MKWMAMILIFNPLTDTYGGFANGSVLYDTEETCMTTLTEDGGGVETVEFIVGTNPRYSGFSIVSYECHGWVVEAEGQD
ncbi:MAG: hypothetical protein COA78_20455 [Blastopirellula sp.]|nr:MAG: hypothetical protein COA78_20455 [Blastopirellula sp.]